MGGTAANSEVHPVGIETNGSSTSDSGHPNDPAEAVGVREVGASRDSSPSTPILVRDQDARKRWKWVPYPLRRLATAVVTWSRGPPNPQRHKISPLLPAVQHAPLWLLDRYLPRRRHRIWLAMGFAVVWIVTYALVMRQGLVATEIAGWGEPGEIGCGNTYWLSGNQCGLDGNDCRPFNGSGFAFRCPANCASYSVLNPRAVGKTEVVYQPLIVGGPPANGSDAPPIYRGDSFICGSAVHAGVITNDKGGCGVVDVVGMHSNFVASARNGLQSVAFDSYFPLSFTFDSGIDCSSTDMRWPLLAISVIFTTLLSLFTTSPALFFFGTFVGVFWNIGLASDPPNHADVPSLVSDLVGKFLPAMLVAWVIYDKMGVRRTLQGLTAQIEKTVLWLGGCWVGALTNYTFDFIPIQRLTPHDLDQQPGAIAALVIVVIVLLVVAVSQVWFFRQEGRLIRYLKLYILLLLGLMVCLTLPGLNLRIHHYILALLLLPGTSMQTRPSLLYQGLLVGLFANGVARWDFDSLLQTSDSLQGDAQLGSLLPSLLTPAIALGANISTITFGWSPPPGPRYDGISILVNDVERFRSYFYDALDHKENFTWTRNEEQINEYFRFAYMEGSQSDDYTKAGVWNAKGEWETMEPGPSKVKSRSLDGEGRPDLWSP